MLGRLAMRAAYVRYLFRPSTWRWIGSRLDALVDDHLLPGADLTWPRAAYIHPTVSFRNARNIEIGEHTRIQPFCVLWASPNSKIRLGRHSGLGPGTMLFSSNHKFAPGVPYHTQGWTEEDITIGEDVWVGAGTVVVAGVSIGDRTVVAAGSVVTRDIPADSIAAGVPAKVLRSRV